MAVLANITIALAKSIAALVSGSSAMFAEAIHSGIDTVNEGLVVLGYRRSRRPNDEAHPFGYGQEAYFWSLLYALLLFAVGGVVAVLRGVDSLRNPEMPGHLGVSYAVLAVALVAESISWVYALRAMAREDPGRRMIDKLLRCKDPSRYVVVGEDAAAVVGIVVAFLGLALSQWTGSPVPDAIASIVIGVVLAGSGVYLAAQTHRLLLGESADDELIERIRGVALAPAEVQDAGDGITMHVGPERIVVAIDATFDPGIDADTVARVIDAIEADIRELDPRIDRIFVEPQRSRDDLESPTQA